MADVAPILIAFDGSDAARRAVSETAELFVSRPVVVATVWEAGLAYASATMPAAGLELQPTPIDIGEAQEVEHELEAHARRVAEEGAELARSIGLDAEAVVVSGDSHASDALVELAKERNVAAIAIGSRGLTGLRARLEGSTSSRVIQHAPCPVLVVHDV